MNGCPPIQALRRRYIWPWPRSSWMKNYKIHDSISLPIAHGEGRYQCSNDVLKKLQDDDSIALRYAHNPNGSINDIAGITGATISVHSITKGIRKLSMLINDIIKNNE